MNMGLKKPALLLCHCLIVIALQADLSHAQYENVWIFGQNAGLDFNGSVPVAITSNINNGMGEANASICDTNGQLLFYTEGSRVFDRQHNLMPNGNNLTPITSVNSYTPTSSTTHGAIIIPVPDHETQYYIFSLTSWEQYLTNTYGRLYYSMVDMSLNNGLGDVVPGVKSILLDTNLTERMTAVVSDNCINIWLLTVSQSDQLKAFEITPAGISNTPVISNIIATLSTPFWGSIYGVGCIAVSPDRNKIAVARGMPGGLSLLDFDPASGTASNEQLLDSGQCYGVCFSPDNTKLYFNHYWPFNHFTIPPYPFPSIYQLDLAAGNLANIINSKTWLTTTFDTVNASHYICQLKLAPDNKIYFQGNSGYTSLSVINFPDQPGLACQPQDNVISLVPGTSMWAGLPNIVPVIKKDSLYTSRKYGIGCETPMALVPHDTSGRDYVWNDGVTGKSRTVSRAGTYWVSYHFPCTYHTDTFEITVRPLLHNFTKVLCANEPYDFNGRWLNSSGTYRDTLATANGCDSIVTLNLIVLSSPEINISVEPELPWCIGDIVLGEATGAKSYQWYRNDRLLGSSDRQYIHLTHLSNQVLVVGQADNDCRDTAEIVLTAHDCPPPPIPPCKLFVPNAFSPNGDGINDRFAPIPHSNSNIHSYRMELFNRWGQSVFSAFEINMQWDGTYNGTPADAGTYFYYISAECMEGTEFIQKGDVMLIR